MGILCALLWTGGFAAVGQTTPTPQPLGVLINLDGIRVHLYCTGTGRPTVMVVGGAFSFDWGLIQPTVAKFTRICTYDPSGTAWSDAYRPNPPREEFTPACLDRVTEIHRLLKAAAIPGPYVLVGFSIGGLITRQYTHEYSEKVAGIVIVDHAFIDVGSDAPPRTPVSTATHSFDSPPILLSSTPITLGLEDDRNFSRLPQQNRDLHVWAMSGHPIRPTAETAAECSKALESSQPYPLGNKPLIVISTLNDTPGYAQLQAQLLRLTRNSKQVVAAQSSHMVIIDEPDVVISGVREVVDAVRSGHVLR